MAQFAPGINLTNVFWRMVEAQRNGKTLIVSYGGSSSSKTISALQYIMLKAMRNPGTRCIVVGQSLPKLRTTCIEDFKTIVMGPRYNPDSWNDTKAVYTYINGSTIRFVGADKPDRFRGVRCDYALYDEATEIPKGAYDQLSIRTRILSMVTFNPSQKFWITSEMLQDNCEVIHSTYKDNPYVEQKIVDDLERKMNTDENFYKVYGLGKWGILSGRIFENTSTVKTFPKTWKWRAIGIDFGWNDEYAIVDVCETANKFYIKVLAHERFMLNEKAKEIIENHFIAIGRRLPCIADSASPRDIKTLQKLGIPVRECSKGPGSILYGIRSMQSKPIRLMAEDESTSGTEFDNYKWKEDRKSGELLDEPEGGKDHTIDASRYVIAEYAGIEQEYVIG